jgi:hypothetical protein
MTLRRSDLALLLSVALLIYLFWPKKKSRPLYVEAEPVVIDLRGSNG